MQSFSTRWIAVPGAHPHLALYATSFLLHARLVASSSGKQSATMATATSALAPNTSHAPHTCHGDAEEVL